MNYQHDRPNAVPWNIILGPETNHGEEIKKYFKKSFTATANHLGISRDALRNKLDREGVIFPKRITSIQKVLDLGIKTENMTLVEIGEAAGCSKFTASRICKQHKLNYWRL